MCINCVHSILRNLAKFDGRNSMGHSGPSNPEADNAAEGWTTFRFSAVVGNLSYRSVVSRQSGHFGTNNY